VYGQVLNLLEAQRTQRQQRQLVAAQAAMALGYGAGLPASSCMVTFGKWHLLNMIQPGSLKQPILPASLILAIRAARRPIADNPDTPLAFLNLARAYLLLPEGLSWKDFRDPSYLVTSLRRIQAATALRAAITLDPDLADAHLWLYQYYMNEQ